MNELIINNFILGALSLLLGAVLWSIRRHIATDDDWKKATDAKIGALMALRGICTQEFATRKDLNEAFNVVRDHGERLSGIEARQDIFEKYRCPTK